MPEPIAVRVPQLNVNDDQVRINAWLVASGQHVEQGQPLAVLESSKSTMEVEAPEAGRVSYSRQPGDEIAVGDTLCHLGAPDASDAASTTTEPSQPPSQAADQEETRTDKNGVSHDLTADAPRFSARARARLEVLGLDPKIFHGQGLVRERDVHRDAGTQRHTTSSAQAPASVDRAAPEAVASACPVQFEPLPRRKLQEARILSAANLQALVSSVTVACPTRGLRRAAAGQPTLRGNATALIVFEVARLLHRFPCFNAFCQDGQLGRYQQVNVGFAVDADRGLKVLVIHDADKKSVPVIAEEMNDLIVGYLEDRVPMTALSGGTFTISDLSGEGVVSFQPLLNQGQSAILGVAGEQFPPGSQEGTFNLILSFDHRISEGRAAAQFLNALRDRLIAHEAALQVVGRGADSERETPRCGRCQRPADQIARLHGYLVRTTAPDDVICSLCLGGF